MSREDVEESLQPVWHLWTRVGPTTDHVDSSGQNWPTVPVVCVHCRQFEPHAPISATEGTADLPSEIWPGYCRLSKPEPWRMKEPVDTPWVGFETNSGSVGPLTRGLIRAVGQAILLAGLAGLVYILFDGEFNPALAYVATAAAIGLGGGINEATKGQKAPSLKRKKG
jgi:hypothetical protein